MALGKSALSNEECADGVSREAHDEAAKQLETDVAIHEALRDQIVVDQDTQDVSGSPALLKGFSRKSVKGTSLLPT